MAEFTIHSKYMRKVNLKSLHQLENISKPLVESTFPFSWWVLVSNVMFDAMINKIGNVNLHKIYSKTNSITIEY